ncbi:MAG: hypothetical protein ACRDZZ_05995 [Ilumatobacteraceae bacterium]
MTQLQCTLDPDDVAGAVGTYRDATLTGLLTNLGERRPIEIEATAAIAAWPVMA